MCGCIICMSICNPSLINDNNSFLKSFVGYELVSLLGVIASITIATTSQLHTMLNDVEKNANSRILNKTRHDIKSDVYVLIFIFLISFFLTIIKSNFIFFLPNMSETALAIINGIAICLVVSAALILIAIVELVFKIVPDVPQK